MTTLAFLKTAVGQPTGSSNLSSSARNPAPDPSWIEATVLCILATSLSSNKKRAARRQTQAFAAVLDSNVMPKFYRCFDLFRQYQLSITPKRLDDDAFTRTGLHR